MGLRARVARRYQITIPEEVRDEAGLKVGDTVNVRSESGKIIIEKIGGNWEAIMNETRGMWKAHPAFKDMKDAVEIVNWLRQKNRDR
ncbi:MAG: AbrB/MazE/SpoVT family DNA-binding domain-containing protein [Nitrososphaerota archaeon]|nr:AbrB/MazE/SpoVT family DNA-binding domain-containing protein [Nitrososphaerota archaeon]